MNNNKSVLSSLSLAFLLLADFGDLLLPLPLLDIHVTSSVINNFSLQFLTARTRWFTPLALSLSLMFNFSCVSQYCYYWG